MEAIEPALLDLSTLTSLRLLLQKHQFQKRNSHSEHKNSILLPADESTAEQPPSLIMEVHYCHVLKSTEARCWIQGQRGLLSWFTQTLLLFSIPMFGGAMNHECLGSYI